MCFYGPRPMLCFGRGQVDQHIPQPAFRTSTPVENAWFSSAHTGVFTSQLSTAVSCLNSLPVARGFPDLRARTAGAPYLQKWEAIEILKASLE